MQSVLLIYAIVLGLGTLLTFALFLLDKNRAMSGGWRISERTLLFFTAVGGGVGALLGIKLGRNKTKDGFWYFHTVAYGATVLQSALLAFLAVVTIF